MSRVRVVGALLLAAACVAASPARAQEPPSGDPSSTTTTLLDPSSTTTSTSVPPEVPPSTDTTVPGALPPTTDTTLPPPPDDPAANGDSPPETVPVVDFTVPPREMDPFVPGITPAGPYARQGSFSSYPGRVVRVTARSARARAAETQAALDSATAMRDALVAQNAQLQANLGQLAVEERQAIEALEAARRNLSQRAADAYIRGNLVPVRSFLASDSAGDFYSRLELLSVVLEADEQAVDDFAVARQAVDAEQAATADALATTSVALLAAEQAITASQFEHELASRELAVFLNGGSFVIHGFVFPVARDYTYGDSFGAPRMVGTGFEHWHEGTDILAPMGTELVAAERGVVTRMGTGVLGGITIWLKGESGTSYYYAHLTGFAPLVHEGLVVDAATVLGYVGTTGNAVGGPPHLHFEIHPDDGPAINPYPILRVAQDQPQPAPIHLDAPPQ